MRRLSVAEPRTRPVVLTDSRVALGAMAKGRSSSAPLNAVMRGMLPYILGGGLYPGMLHVSSEANRADGPSRQGPLTGPTREVPPWVSEVADGEYKRFDAVLAGAAVTIPKTTVDENGKFSYYSSDMRPVPPGKLNFKNRDTSGEISSDLYRT